jgi:hypothetical protein
MSEIGATVRFADVSAVCGSVWVNRAPFRTAQAFNIVARLSLLGQYALAAKEEVP